MDMYDIGLPHHSGLTIPIHNQKTGEVDTAQIFVAVLGASGYTYTDASLSQKQEDFIHSHVNAYQFFGGVPLIVVPDNLKSAVISNNKNGIVINESYAALARCQAQSKNVPQRSVNMYHFVTLI